MQGNQYINLYDRDYIEVTGVSYDNVIKLDRNGIGVKYNDEFDLDVSTVDYSTMTIVGFYTGFVLDPNAYLTKIFDSVTSYRSTLFEVGPTVGVDYVYIVENGDVLAYYITSALDTEYEVQQGLDGQILAATWDGFTVTTSQFGNNQIRVDFSNTTGYFNAYIGKVYTKEAHYITIDSVDYLLEFGEQYGVGNPAPAVSASYNLWELTEVGDIETYLAQDLVYDSYGLLDGVNGTISLSQISGVPNGECVIDEANQRIYFPENLNIGEFIKVFQK